MYGFMFLILLHFFLIYNSFLSITAKNINYVYFKNQIYIAVTLVISTF
nr:MAG TPA_asm: hypothetical protein [Caudoviricetes sp.]